MRYRLLLAGGVAGTVCAASMGLAGCDAVFGIHAAHPWPDAESGPGATAQSGCGEEAGCAEYCCLMAKNCSGSNAEFMDATADTNPCMTLCSLYPNGSLYPYPGPPPASVDASLDTLGCRLWYAYAAADLGEGGAPVNCPRAGPLGSDLCGGPIHPFCELDTNYCIGQDENIVGYDGGIAGCEATLNAVNQGDANFYLRTGDILLPPGDNIVSTGNTLNCRLWHLEFGIQEDNPMIHCPHTLYPSETQGATTGSLTTNGAPCQ
ncbi:MAG: hypothetical protein ABSF69_19790 [Polyangiaceae bacterium]